MPRVRWTSVCSQVRARAATLKGHHYQRKHKQVALLLPIPQAEEGIGLVRLIGGAPAGGEGHYHQVVAPAPEQGLFGGQGYGGFWPQTQGCPHQIRLRHQFTQGQADGGVAAQGPRTRSRGATGIMVQA